MHEKGNNLTNLYYQFSDNIFIFTYISKICYDVSSFNTTKIIGKKFFSSVTLCYGLNMFTRNVKQIRPYIKFDWKTHLI